MINFTRILQTEDGFSSEFFFNRIYTANGIHFHISVIDRNHEFCHFAMTEKSGKWKIVHAPLPPDWIMNLEGILDRVICESIQS